HTYHVTYDAVPGEAEHGVPAPVGQPLDQQLGCDLLHRSSISPDRVAVIVCAGSRSSDITTGDTDTDRPHGAIAALHRRPQRECPSQIPCCSLGGVRCDGALQTPSPAGTDPSHHPGREALSDPYPVTVRRWARRSHR